MRTSPPLWCESAHETCGVKPTVFLGCSVCYSPKPNTILFGAEPLGSSRLESHTSICYTDCMREFGLRECFVLLVLLALDGCSDKETSSSVHVSGSSAGFSSGTDVPTAGEALTSSTSLSGNADDSSQSSESTVETGHTAVPSTEPITPDLGNQQCLTWLQDCPGGMKCVPFSEDGESWWNASKCVPESLMPIGFGEPCSISSGTFSGIDDCEKGSFCRPLKVPEDDGICTPFCLGSQIDFVCMDPELLCWAPSETVIPVCLESCYPVEGSCSMSGDTCIPSTDGFLCLPQEAAGKRYEPCSAPVECSLGLTCVPSSLSPSCDQNKALCCMALCNLPDDLEAICADDEQCGAFWDDANIPVGYEDLGICEE